jgi:hypothetical protein
LATQYGKSIVLEALASGSHTDTNQGEVQLYTTGSGSDAKLALRRAGSDTQRLVATNEYSLVDGDGIADFTFDGTANASIAIDLATNPGLQFSSNKLIAKVDGDALQLGASGIDLMDTIAGARTWTAAQTFTSNILANGNITGDGSTVLSGLTQLTASYAKIDVLDVNRINSNTTNETVTVLEVIDKLIIAASGSASSAADGGGLQIGGVSGTDAVASVLYEHTGAKLEFNIAGTAYASVDAAGMDVTGDLDVSADLGAATITMTGFAVGADGDTNLKSLRVDDNSYIGSDSITDLIQLQADGDIIIKDGAYDFDIASHDGTNGLLLGGTLVSASAAELNLLDTAAANTVVNSKAVIYGSSGEVKGASLQATGLTVNGGLAFSNGSGQFSESSNLLWNGSNAMIVTGYVSASAGLRTGGTLEAEGAALLDSSLTVLSASVLQGTLDVAGIVNLNLVTDATNSTSGALIVDGGVGIAKKLYVGTDLDVDGTANLDAVDIDGNVQADGTITVGVNGTGYDVKFFGDTSGSYFLWDTTSNGVGIGKACVSGYAVDVATGHGNMRADAFVTYSDRTLKTNIQKMDDCLDKVMKLEPTTYDKIATGKSEIGFIAQDVAKVVPEVCAFDANGEGRGIDYSRMSTLFVGAIKAQQDQIAQLKAIVAKMQK